MLRLVRAQYPALTSQLLCKKLGKTVKLRGSEKNINVRIALLQRLNSMWLSCHTAANGNYRLRASRLYMLILSNQRQRSLLCVLTDGAGIDNDKMRLLGLVRNCISHKGAHSSYLLAVRLILLTAESQHECLGTSTHAICKLTGVSRNKIYISLLTLMGKQAYFRRSIQHNTVQVTKIPPKWHNDSNIIL